MPTVYQVRILDHLVDHYDRSQRGVVGAERRLEAVERDERAAWDEHEAVANAPVSDAASPDRRRYLARRVREAAAGRHAAEHDLSVARADEQRAMRTLCDAVLLAARGE